MRLHLAILSHCAEGTELFFPYRLLHKAIIAPSYEMINNVSMQFLSDIDNSLMCFIMHVYRHRPFRDRRGPCSPFLIVKISLAWQLSVSYMSFFLDQSVPIKSAIHSELAGY